MVFEDMVGDTTDGCCQSLESFVLFVWQVNWE